MAEIESFGPWIRRRRRGLDLTQEELARRVGCARITVRKIEAGQLRPSKQMAHLLAETLGIAPTDYANFLLAARGVASISVVAEAQPPHNLPFQLTSFVGRTSEVAHVRQLLQRSRLVTLTGSAGTGKTRLALQVAAEVLERFHDGVWLVELAPLSNPSLVPTAVASVLGVRAEHGRPLTATLHDWLRNRQLLILLDNCEHLLEACALFADAALHAGAEVSVLATSREALGIAGETSYRVPSLACPEPSKAREMSIEQLAEYPAVELFVERTRLALPTFDTAQSSMSAIAEICYRLDGIPLAIELAAARVRAMPIDQIASRLDDRFRLLADGSRTALPRHQTLRALVDWSYNLLSDPERELLARLSVFVGGWTTEAAEEICAGERIARSDVLGLLVRLSEKCLIAQDDLAAEPRFRMLETIREYSREKLLQAEDIKRLRQQHLQYYLNLAERTRPLLEGTQRPEWMTRLQLEHDNLLAALEWASTSDAETARWLAGILERFWFYGDHLGEARTWFARVLSGTEQAPTTKGLALAFLGSGCVAFNLELMDEAQLSMETSVRLWQELGDTTWTAWALGWLGYLLLQRGEAARANAIYTEGESLFRASGIGLPLIWVLSSWGAAKCILRRDDPAGKALLDEALALAFTFQDPFGFEMCYSTLGDWAMLQGDYATARAHFLEALEWRRKLGTRWIIAAGLWQVASIMRLGGDYVMAEPLYAEALTMARELGDQRSQAHVAQERGTVAIHLGDFERAESLLAESLGAYRRWADALGIARCLLSFADLRHHRGQFQEAARLLSFVDGWLESNRIQLVHFDRTDYHRIAAAVRAKFDQGSWTESQASGRRQSLEQAIGDAVPQAAGLPS